jgi:hypothetical protein
MPDRAGFLVATHGAREFNTLATAHYTVAMNKFAPVVIAILLAGCASAGRVAPVEPPTSNPVVVDRDFPKAHGILAGIDPAASFEAWQAGSAVLYGVRLIDGGASQSWYVLIDVLSGLAPCNALIRINPSTPQPRGRTCLDIEYRNGPPAEFAAIQWRTAISATAQNGEKLTETVHSDAVVTRISVFNDEGESIDARYVQLPEAFLRGGFFDACRRMAATDRRRMIDDADLGPIMRSVPSLTAFCDIVANTPALSPIVRTVIPTRSILRAMFSLNPGMSFSSDMKDVVAVRDLPAGLEQRGIGYRFPLDVNVGGRAALRCFVTVTSPEPPLHVCAGVVRCDGVRLDDSDKRLIIQVLAARQASSEPRP